MRPDPCKPSPQYFCVFIQSNKITINKIDLLILLN